MIKTAFSQVARCRVRGEIVAEAQAGIDANRSSIAEGRSQANEDWVCANLLQFRRIEYVNKFTNRFKRNYLYPKSTTQAT